jgi:hypothetical protein
MMGKNAVEALDQCLGGALMSGSLAPVVLMVCAPINVPAAMMKARNPNSKPEISEETLADIETKTNAFLKNADLSPALVATIDEQSQHNAYLAKYEISHGTLPLPENGETIVEVAAQWDYQTVAEIRIIEAGFESDAGKAPLLHFSMTAEVKTGRDKIRIGTGQAGIPLRWHTTALITSWFGDDLQRFSPGKLRQANRTRLPADILSARFSSNNLSL